MRLIDADVLKNELDVQYFVNNERVFDIPQIKAFVDIQPTVEARPSGEWITELDYDGWIRHECSVCGYAKCTDIHVSLGWDFCPNCGCDMRGGKNGTL